MAGTREMNTTLLANIVRVVIFLLRPRRGESGGSKLEALLTIRSFEILL